MTQIDDSGYRRLEDQIQWYDTKSSRAQKAYKKTKYFTITVTAVIPIFAVVSFSYSEFLIAALSAMVAIFEGANQINQWQHNWITYRSTCEALRHEKFTYMERADPYDFENPSVAKKLLVERVESLISTEHSKWIAVQEEGAKTERANPKRPLSRTD